MVEFGFRLLAAGLIDSAIRDVLTGKDEAGDALEWLQGSPAPLTFDDCAKAFRAEPEALREAILRMVREPRRNWFGGFAVGGSFRLAPMGSHKRRVGGVRKWAISAQRIGRFHCTGPLNRAMLSWCCEPC